MNGFAFITDHEARLCPACGSDRFKLFARVRTPYLERKERYEIVICRECGHGRALGRCDQGFLAAIYSGPFFSSSQQSVAAATAPINANARARAVVLARQAAGRLLDIGAGNGAFLAAARQYFEVEGVELSGEAAETARALGLTVHVGDVRTQNLGAACYDVITLWDVLASLPDPQNVLGMCHQLLKPGGLVVLTLPMIDTAVARLTRGAWPLLVPPVNLHYFSRQSVDLLARKTKFAVRELRHRGKLVSLRFVAEKAARSLGLFGASERFARFIPAWAVPVNTGDIATVFLRKLAEPA